MKNTEAKHLKRPYSWMITFSILCLAATARLSATDFYISPNGNGNGSTDLRAANINTLSTYLSSYNANRGRLYVYVAPGTYNMPSGGLSVTNNNIEVFIIPLISGNSNNPVFQAVSGYTNFFMIKNGAILTVDGIDLKGIITGTSVQNPIDSEATLILKNLTVSKFEARNCVVQSNNGTLRVENCIFSESSVIGGSSVISSKSSDLLINGCLFTANKLLNTIPVMIRIENGNQTIVTRTTIRKNRFQGANSNTTPIFILSTVLSNGGIFVNNTVSDNDYGNLTSDLKFQGTNTNVFVVNNTLEKGIIVYGSSTSGVTFANNLIFNGAITMTNNIGSGSGCKYYNNAFGGNFYASGFTSPTYSFANTNLVDYLEPFTTIPGVNAQARPLKIVNGANPLLSIGGAQNRFAAVASYLKYDQLDRPRPTNVSIGAWDDIKIWPKDDPATTQLGASATTVKVTDNDDIHVSSYSVIFGTPTDLNGNSLTANGNYGSWTTNNSTATLSYTPPPVGSQKSGTTVIPTSVVVFPYTIRTPVPNSNAYDERTARALIFVVENDNDRLSYCGGQPYTFALRKLPHTAFQIFNGNSHLTNDPSYVLTNVANTLLSVQPRIITDIKTNDDSDDTRLVFPKTDFRIQGNANTDTGPFFRVPNER